MGDEGEDKGAAKVALWLGLAASAMSVLAFFGIANFSALKNWGHPQAAAKPSFSMPAPRLTYVFPSSSPSPSPSPSSPDVEACHLAHQALDTELSESTTGRPTVAQDAGFESALAGAYTSASFATSDLALRSDLQATSFDVQQFSTALAGNDAQAAQRWGSADTGATATWEQYCESQRDFD